MIARDTSAVDASVIICAYTDRRWDQLRLGYHVSLSQLHSGDQLIVVIDHNDELLQRARRELTQALVVENAETPGLSGARNTGVSYADGDFVVFLDDDACPEPGWLDAYHLSFEDPDVTVVGGAVDAAWDLGAPPRWFPAEFGWVVGCDYRGLPETGAQIRNPIGANMAIRREALNTVGGFAADVGRTANLPMGCEETDLCIRVRQTDPDAVMVRNTAAAVRHAVSADRRRFRYFLSRCYYEGRSKEVLSDRVGAKDGLASERGYAAKTLTSGVLHGLRSGLAGHWYGPLRAGAITAGFSATALGFASARMARWRAAQAARLEVQPIWRPLVLSEFRLGETNNDITPVAGSRMRLLVTADRSPWGFLDLAPSEPVPSSTQVAERLQPADDSGHHPTADTFEGSLDYTPMVTVVIPTRARSFELVRCVRSVLAVDYPNFEVLVVDNNDRVGVAAELLAPVAHDIRLRVLHQPDRGVSPARNLGIVEARGEIIAATDDDVVVSPHWLLELVAPFKDPDIGCVTGLVVPNGFSSPAQEMFEEFGGFSKGFLPNRYDLADNQPDHVLYPYSPGMYGSGNNVAYRRSTIGRLGGYDRRLGPGTPARAGEDLDLFLKILFDGRTIYYQPRAWVRHHHRDSVDELRNQLRDYGRGLTAVMLTWAMSDPRRGLDILRRLPAGLRHLLDPRSDKNEARSAGYPPALRRSEIRGMVEGLFLTGYQRLQRPAGGRVRTGALDLHARADLQPASPVGSQGVSHRAG